MLRFTFLSVALVVPLAVLYVLIRRRSHVKVAVGFVTIAFVLALLGSLGGLVTSIGDAYVDDRITIQVRGETDAYYAELDADEVPRDPASPTDPVIESVLERNDRVAAPNGAEVDLAVHRPAAAGKLASVAGATLPGLLAAVTAGLLLLVLRRAAGGDPFAPRSARELQVLGWVLLAGLPLMELARSATGVLALGGSWVGIGMHVPTGGTWQYSFAWVLPGLVVLAVAGIWREGVRLRDVEHTTV